MNFHLLFEQSGTFRDMLRSNGHSAFDYDIDNHFGRTDYIVDLFNEIEKEYDNLVNGVANETIFDKMQPNFDFIIAFFPCTHFSSKNECEYKIVNSKNKILTLPKVQYVIERNQNRAKFFEVYVKFCYIMQVLKIPTIIENPATGRTYLELFSPIPIAYKESNRALFGDYFVKPTNYYAINFNMIEKFSMFFDCNYFTKLNHSKKGIYRSLMSPTYAQNFYDRFLSEL